MTIDFKKSNQALEILSGLNLDSIEANRRISYLIKNRLIMPYIFTNIPVGFYLYRARENQGGQEFTKKDQISYNRNKSKITQGRVNKKGQSIFYASHNWETPLFETSSLIRNGIKNGKEVFTIGRWLVKDSFLLSILIPQLTFLNEHIEILGKYKSFLKNAPELSDPDTIKHLQFFSEQFARSVKGNNNLYKISSTYFNHVITNSKEKVFGMIYPTVEYDYNDLNVALLPEAVDKFLILDMVVKYELSIKEGKGDFRPLEILDIDSFNKLKIIS